MVVTNTRLVLQADDGITMEPLISIILLKQPDLIGYNIMEVFAKQPIGCL